MGITVIYESMLLVICQEAEVVRGSGKVATIQKRNGESMELIEPKEETHPKA